MTQTSETSNAGTVEQEVRFAVVLYGGVSLAIYINGVSQELLRLVRSTAKPAGELDAIEKVYRKLGQAIASGVVPVESPSPHAPVRTRFRIDVISGTSAGGINGVFLAKALANDSRLNPVQDLWFKEGALEKLLNDEKSQADLPFSAAPGKRSLLNSARMYYELLNAFEGMDADQSGKPGGPGLTDQVSLFATTTDITGVPLPIQLSDEIVYERRYRNVFRMRYSEGSTFEAARNDFAKEYNPFLAFASRCTSSFPFAFEPMRLADIDAVLQTHPKYKDQIDEYGAGSKRWQEFFRQYLTTSTSDKPLNNTPFAQRAFGDGGYLNNKPFSYAIDALTENESDLPVERKLIYVEPSPEHPESEPPASAPPNAIQNSIDALITIPGYQTIREDMSRALDRNTLIARVNQAILQIESDAALIAGNGNDQSERAIPEISFQDNSYLRQYYRLRVTDVTDQLTEVIARSYDIEAGTSPHKCLRAVVHEWRIHVYESGNGKTIFDFLRSFDLPYRLRRLRFLLRKLDAFTSPANREGAGLESVTTAARFSGMEAPEEGWTRQLRGNRSVLVRAYRVLLGLRRSLLRDEIPLTGAVQEPGAPSQDATDPRRAVIGVLGDRPTVLNFLKSMFPSEDPLPESSSGDRAAKQLTTRKIMRRRGDPQDVDALVSRRAKEMLRGATPFATGLTAPGQHGQSTGMMGKLEELGQRLARELEQVLGQKEIRAAIDLLATPAARALRPFFVSFDLFDSTVFPILYGTPAGDSVPVEIIRLSPEDVTALQPDFEVRRRKLKGLVAAHFGAFLDEKWRENDLLWGRLDAAERLITTLLPFQASETLRNQLIDEAQAAIIEHAGVREAIRKMALERVGGKRANVRLTAANADQVVAALTAVPPASLRVRNQAVMENWTTVLPDTMDRKR